MPRKQTGVRLYRIPLVSARKKAKVGLGDGESVAFVCELDSKETIASRQDDAAAQQCRDLTSVIATRGFDAENLT
jgi:hypothetical protein